MRPTQLILILAALTSSLSAQGIRGPVVAAPGSSITVEVATNDPSVELVDPVTGETTSYPVAPGKNTTIPIPHVPGGTILIILVGQGLRAQCLFIEIISTGP